MSVTTTDVIAINPAPFIVAKATVASIMKGAFIRDTFVRDRQVFNKIQRSLQGDMAKLCVASWLRSQGFQVIDWDDVRTSWRSQRKSYDLEVNGHALEIKSSIATVPQIIQVITNEHIIHPCNVRVKEVTIQTFFDSSLCSEVWVCGWVRQVDLENQNRKQVMRIGRRLVDFYMVPFNDIAAEPMINLLNYL
jgi:hypothetical protein